MTYGHDPEHGRTYSMWSACGIQFRSNVVDADGEIPLHAHSYPHVAMCTEGWFDVREQLPNGEALTYQVAAKGFKTDDPEFATVGYRIVIPAGHQHLFTPRGVRGEIVCMWGE